MHVIVLSLWMIYLELIAPHINTNRQHGVIALKLVSPKLIYNTKGNFKIETRVSIYFNSYKAPYPIPATIIDNIS